jgi:single-stranded-DNA-specific exonuclease
MNWLDLRLTGKNKTDSMEKRWKIKEEDKAITQELKEQLNVDSAIAGILTKRGITGFEAARIFFNPDASQLHDPFLMKDMEKAVTAILSAIKNKQKILVFGDYDVDGTTAVACMYQFLVSIYEPEMVDYYIPDRYREGYGISAAGIQYAADNEYKLMVALDCGIKSVDLIGVAKASGVEVIVCDHHLPGNELPPALAILNPKQKDCSYPYKELCGCGVGFKLITAIVTTLGKDRECADYYLDLVATAIAADIVPMTGENRVLAYLGLKRVNENPSAGIKALIELNGLKKSLVISNLVFIIAPRVNAAGRMHDGKSAVKLFVEKDKEKAKEWAEKLHVHNSERKEADTSITEQAIAMIENDIVLKNRKSTVLFQDHWHKGVIGIVASRLIEHYYRPTIVLTQSGELIAGSARSIPGFNIHEGLDGCKEFLIGFGGHYFAAGMTLHPTQLEAFISRFEEIVATTVPAEAFIPEIQIDANVDFTSINGRFFRILQRMEPFGPENLNPVLVSYNVRNRASRIVKEKHIRFDLVQNGINLKGIGFNMADKYHIIETNLPIDIVFTIEENEWNNEKSIQLKVIDFRLSETATTTEPLLMTNSHTV